MRNKLPVIYSLVALLSAGIISGGIYLGLSTRSQASPSADEIVVDTASSEATSEAIEENEMVETENTSAAAQPKKSSNVAPAATTQAAPVVDTAFEIEKCRVSSEKLEGISIDELTAAGAEAVQNYKTNTGLEVDQEMASKIFNAVVDLYKHNLYDECIDRISG